MRMNPLDAVWLLLESRDTPMHVGVLAEFRTPRGSPADYLRGVVARLRACRDVAAPWHYRLAEPPLPTVSPRLVEEAEFDRVRACLVELRDRSR